MNIPLTPAERRRALVDKYVRERYWALGGLIGRPVDYQHASETRWDTYDRIFNERSTDAR